MQHMRANCQAQIPLPGTCWQPKGCILRALLPGTRRWQYIDSALATSATGRLGSLKSWIVQSVTVQPLSHFFIIFWNAATRINSLGLEWMWRLSAHSQKPQNGWTQPLMTRCQSLHYSGHTLCHNNQSSILQTYDLYPVIPSMFNLVHTTIYVNLVRLTAFICTAYSRSTYSSTVHMHCLLGSCTTHSTQLTYIILFCHRLR